MSSVAGQLHAGMKYPMRAAPKTNLEFLDGLRGLAAAFVMIGHARWLLWEGYNEGFMTHPERYSFLGKMMVYTLSFFRYGHQAVLFFFVLSGFVIHLKYSIALKKNKDLSFDLGNYIVRRLRRIYPAFIFALLLTWILDSTGAISGFTIYVHQTPNALINTNITNDHSLPNLFGNLFFLQGGRVGTWGTNGPLWSLKFEWWFYILYPVLFLVNRRSVTASAILVILISFSTLFIRFPEMSFAISVLQYLLCWWLGGILADIYTGRIVIKYSWLAGLTLIIPLLIVFEKKINNAFLDTGWAIGFFGLLSAMFYLREKGFRHKWLGRIKWLGDSSYTLYIIHFPVLVLFNGIILHYTGNKMPGTLVFVFAGIFFCLTLAWLLHFLTEKPFTRKREVIKPALGA